MRLNIEHIDSRSDDEDDVGEDEMEAEGKDYGILAAHFHESSPLVFAF